MANHSITQFPSVVNSDIETFSVDIGALSVATLMLKAHIFVPSKPRFGLWPKQVLDVHRNLKPRLEQIKNMILHDIIQTSLKLSLIRFASKICSTLKSKTQP